MNDKWTGWFWLWSFSSKRELVPSTPAEARWCSWASGRRSERSCWTGSSSPPRTSAAGRPGPRAVAAGSAEAAPPTGRGAETRRRKRRRCCSPAAPLLPHQKGRKRIQRRCEPCSWTHKHTCTERCRRHRLVFSNGYWLIGIYDDRTQK